MDTTTLQKVSFQAGYVHGQDPATGYGMLTPEGLDSVSFVAGLIEGRSQARTEAARVRAIRPKK